MDGIAKIWDAFDTGAMVQSIAVHSGAIRDAQWSIDGSTVLTAGFDCTARQSDATTGACVRVFNAASGVAAVRWHPSQPHLFVAALAADGGACYDTRAPGGPTLLFKGPVGQVLCAGAMKPKRCSNW